MTFSVRIFPEPMRSIDSSTFTGSYQMIGTAFSNIICLMKIVNNSSVDVTVSWDGLNDHDYLPAGSFSLYDITAQTQRQSGIYIAKGTQILVKGNAGTGSVYLISLYPQET